MSRRVTTRKRVWWRFSLIAVASLLTLGQALAGDWFGAAGSAALGFLAVAIVAALSWENEQLQRKLRDHQMRRLLADVERGPLPASVEVRLHADTREFEAALLKASQNIRRRGGAL